MDIVFFTCLGIIAWTYFGYPLALILLTAGRRAPQTTSDTPSPHVSLIISAHNESSIIEQKLENSLALEYPGNLLEIIVASDGSTDDTSDIVRSYKDRGIKLIDAVKHVGKTVVQNLAVRESSGDILVFSDANALYAPEAIRELVGLFDDKKVGCVCGELTYRNDTSSVGKSESAYWRYEKFCKKRESLLGRLLGVNGAIYAVRRTCFVELAPDVISDFILPILIHEQGHTILYSPKARAFENPSHSFEHEYSRKKRIINRSLHGLFKHARFLNIFRYGLFSFELWSHKMIRWMVPFFLLGMIASNLFLLDSGLFRITGALQAIFYLLAIIGKYGGNGLRSFRIVYIPYYFTTINTAAFFAFIDLITGKRYDRWTTADR